MCFTRVPARTYLCYTTNTIDTECFPPVPFRYSPIKSSPDKVVSVEPARSPANENFHAFRCDSADSDFRFHARGSWFLSRSTNGSRPGNWLARDSIGHFPRGSRHWFQCLRCLYQWQVICIANAVPGIVMPLVRFSLVEFTPVSDRLHHTIHVPWSRVDRSIYFESSCRFLYRLTGIYTIYIIIRFISLLSILL